jgi:hypothetical protein
MVLLMGCSKGIDYKKYLTWYESEANPLHKKQIIGDIEYTCTYLVTDYFLARDIASGVSPDPKSEDLSEYYKINIKIKNNQEPLTYQIENSNESYERINYLVSDIKDDILLVTSTDSLSCQLHHYERVYHVGNTLSVMFIFDKTDNPESRTILFNDRLFGNNILRFTFDKDEIKTIPILKK